MAAKTPAKKTAKTRATPRTVADEIDGNANVTPAPKARKGRVSRAADKPVTYSVDPKPVEAAKTADAAPATVTDSSAGNVTVAKPKAPAKKAWAVGNVKVVSETVKNQRRKDVQQVTVHAAGTEVTITLTPAGKGATVAVNGQKV